MNKAISINLAGIFFHIEEDAYEALSQYLNSLAQYFSQEEDGSEIISDIEARIAEMLTESLQKHKRQVVLAGDVEIVMDVMGLPEEIDGEVSSRPNNTYTTQIHTHQQSRKKKTTSQTEYKQTDKKNRRLYRDKDSKMVAGVCSGLTAYFGINDPIWLRLAFALSIFTGYGILVYLLLWVIVPKAKTPAEKLAMHGEPINVSNIERTFRKGVDDIKDQYQEFNATEEGQRTRSFFKQFGQSLGEIVRKIVVLFVYVGIKLAKVLLIILAISALIALVGILFSVIIAIIKTIGFLLKFIFTSALPVIVGTVSTILIIGVPIILISYLLFRTSFKSKVRNKHFGKGLMLVWILSLVSLIAISSTTYEKEFSSKSNISAPVAIQQPTGQTMIIEASTTPPDGLVPLHHSDISLQLPFFRSNKTFLDQNKETIVLEEVTLDIVKSETDQFQLIQKASALGGSKQSAQTLAENVQYEFTQNDSTIFFSPYYAVPQSDKWRHQQLQLTLKVPVGKSVYLAPSSEEVIYDIKNTTDTYDGHMLGKTWTMLPEGLTLVASTTSATNNDASIVRSTSPSHSGVSLTPDEGEALKSVDLADFQRLHFQGNFDIHIQHSEDYNVQFLGDEEDIQAMKIKKPGSKLYLSFDEKWFQNNQETTVQVQISMPKLREVAFSGSSKADLYIADEVADLQLNLTGFSQCEVNGIQVQKLTTDVSGASILNLSGHAQKLYADVSGASSFSADDLQVAKADVEVSGASSLTVYANEKLYAEASGASTITYLGNPETFKMESSGMSTIQQD